MQKITGNQLQADTVPLGVDGIFAGCAVQMSVITAANTGLTQRIQNFGTPCTVGIDRRIMEEHNRFPARFLCSGNGHTKSADFAEKHLAVVLSGTVGKPAARAAYSGIADAKRIVEQHRQCVQSVFRKTGFRFLFG